MDYYTKNYGATDELLDMLISEYWANEQAKGESDEDIAVRLEALSPDRQ